MYGDIVEILKGHFSPKPLVIVESFRFHGRNHEEGESVTMFETPLNKLSEHWEFHDLLNDTIRDSLVCGLWSEATQKRLLTESNLTLAKAIEVSMSVELAAKRLNSWICQDECRVATENQRLGEIEAHASAVAKRDIRYLHIGIRTWIAEPVVKGPHQISLQKQKELRENVNDSKQERDIPMKGKEMLLSRRTQM
jgi:hypothetical protein